jgi:hypothetical protein
MIWATLLRFAPVVVIAALCVGTVLYAHNRGTQSGMSQVQNLWDQEKLAVAQAIAEELERVRAKEQALQAKLTKQRREYQYESDRLNALYLSALGSLSDRPDRPADSPDVPQDSNAGAVPADGCTGAELFRPDADFLVREAGRADQLRIALRACIAHSAEIERELNQ